jgi:ssDNA-binding Zn-finger/Zn-ribbon topoisomerase 1
VSPASKTWESTPQRRKNPPQAKPHHAHKCPDCGTVWWHEPKNASGLDYEVGHTCPTCDTLVREVFVSHNEARPDPLVALELSIIEALRWPI